MGELVAAIGRPRARNLVFTSAGDRSNLRRWLAGRRNFDLWVVYYGARPGRWRDEADLYLERRGAKFPNLHYCYERYREVVSRYEAVMVMDDDIIIDGSGLSRLFDIRRELDLWLLQPAFRATGKISWQITRVHPGTRLRYTNFVEMACPLFRRDKLDAFMAVYDPQVVGYGVDWWFMHVLDGGAERRVAVVDEVSCVNPHDRTKGGVREIDRVQSAAGRRAAWHRVQERHGIPKRGKADLVELGAVPQAPLRAALSRLACSREACYLAARRWAARTIRRAFPGACRSPA